MVGFVAVGGVVGFAGAGGAAPFRGGSVFGGGGGGESTRTPVLGGGGCVDVAWAAAELAKIIAAMAMESVRAINLILPQGNADCGIRNVECETRGLG